MAPSKYRRSCDACQRRHIKCDLKQPCGACKEAGKQCVSPSKYHFRNNEDPDVKSGAKRRPKRFAEDQPWTQVPEKLQYVVESSETSRDSPAADDDQNEQTPSHENLQSYTPISPSQTYGPSPLRESIWEPVNQTPESGVLSEQSPRYHSSTPYSAHPLHDPSPSDSDAPLWPVRTKEEGLMFRHFVTQLSVWLDFLDERKHFSTVVVQAAATSPALHYAILALASKHMSLTGGCNAHTPDRYQLQCLNILIPALRDPDAILDENLFAATTILRLFDEMTERTAEEEATGGDHVLGSHMLLAARQRAPTLPTTPPSTLRYAALKIELRQDVHISFVRNRSASSLLVQYCDIDRSFNDTDDWTWTWRIIAHCSDTLTYCNGEEAKTLERWRELWLYLDMWERSLPRSFTPFYEGGADPEGKGKLFPELLFANDCHAGGHQYQSIARILLLANDPQIPALGLDRVLALQERDHQIKTEVLRICGIALSNSQFTPVTFCAGIAVAMCGERFVKREEQEPLMRILEQAEGHVAWRSLRASERMKTVWRWS